MYILITFLCGHSTRRDVEHKLLKGEQVTWRDPNKKVAQLILDDPKKQRLFAYLLASKVRQPTNLSSDFVSGLSQAYSEPAGTATPLAPSVTVTPIPGPWRLHLIETEGFGGLNVWNGPLFRFDFDQQSLLLEGPNGSGKSSLVGAILWALSGERPRDHAKTRAEEAKPVFDQDDKLAGDWPPIACYPLDAANLKSPPHVKVKLEFRNPAGHSATVKRTLDGGTVSVAIDPGFEIPSILLEAGLLMPTRLAALRLDAGRGRLTNAVQTLTGLDDLAAIGLLVEGLCHKGREYLSFRRKDLETAKRDFDKAIAIAREALVGVVVAVSDFAPGDTDDAQGTMATFGKMLADQATKLTKVVSSDLSPSLKLDDPAIQRQVITAIGSAQIELKSGLDGIPSWSSFSEIGRVFDDDAAKLVSAAIATARKEAEEAVDLLKKSAKDPKFQLKALGAQWHSKHKSGAVDACPLCDHELKSNPSLVEELEALRSAANSAARTFDDNLNAISTQLETFIPAPLKKYGSETLAWKPRAKLIGELRAALVSKDSFATILVRFGGLVEAALAKVPDEELDPVESAPGLGILKVLNERMAEIERLLCLAKWFHTNSRPWSQWWQNLVTGNDPVQADVGAIGKGEETRSDADKTSEGLMSHLTRLSDALAKAEPYRKGAEAMRAAWKSGKSAAEIEKELNRRQAIAESLAPLKSLVPLSESIAREAIEDLSERIGNILDQLHLSEQLRFHDAKLTRREGLTVRGAVVPKLLIDATLVANTSWLRAVLWAFLFALREEGVEQIGNDPFPVLVFDDPQATFDSEHRHRWAQYVVELQNGASQAQILLTSYDVTFLDMIKVAGVSGRGAMIAAPGPDLPHAGIFEGESLDREWSEAQKLNTPKAYRDYIGAVRVYVEGMLRLMLRGEDANVASVVTGFVLGESREKLNQLNSKGIPPWDRPHFKKLMAALDKSSSPIKHMEMAHHAGVTVLGIAEAKDVEEHWRKKIRPALDDAFHQVREYHLVHGDSKALHAAPPTVALPEGYQAKVEAIPLRVLGRAAALSNGRVADGLFELDEFDSSGHKKIVLAQHLAYRLSSRTLEPVARPGDVLLVKEPGEPSVKSLVIALSDDRIFARRFEIAGNHSDVAVLTAQAINPRQIAPPFIARRSTLTLHKIVGVIYEDSSWNPPVMSEMEVCECGGESVFKRLSKNSFGLVEVVGQSAEPHALSGQYLIVTSEMTGAEALKLLDGRPVIAADSDDNRYFKRLRIAGEGRIVLESLDSGGDYGPIVLSAPGQGGNCLERVWPVAGVLFEIPK